MAPSLLLSREFTLPPARTCTLSEVLQQNQPTGLHLVIPLTPSAHKYPCVNNEILQLDQNSCLAVILRVSCPFILPLLGSLPTLKCPAGRDIWINKKFQVYFVHFSQHRHGINHTSQKLWFLLVGHWYFKTTM
jgi:hypothetical protein